MKNKPSFIIIALWTFVIGLFFLIFVGRLLFLSSGKKETDRESNLSNKIDHNAVAGVIVSSKEIEKRSLWFVQAAQKGDIKTLERLFNEKLNINAEDKFGRIALIEAAGEGRLEVVRWLLEHGANVNEQNFNGYSSLLNATFRGDLEMIKLLVSYHAEINMRHISKGPHIDVYSTDFKTASNYALSRGYSEIAKYLLENNADPQYDRFGDSSFLAAK